MKDLIKRRMVFVDSEQTMTEVLHIMRDQNVSCVLVLNKDREVVGIVTERDIVHKFTLLENQEKLLAKVGAFMTRPVTIARLNSLEDDVTTMFFEKSIRHFPISAGSNQEKDILGILTVTDVSRAYLSSLRNETVALQREAVTIIAADPMSRGRYCQLFSALKFDPVSEGEIEKLLAEAMELGYPVLFDMDRIPIETTRKHLSVLKGHKGVFILLSSHANVVEPLRKLLTSDVHFVALKPLDISYILLLLAQMKAGENKVDKS